MYCIILFFFLIRERNCRALKFETQNIAWNTNRTFFDIVWTFNNFLSYCLYKALFRRQTEVEVVKTMEILESIKRDFNVLKEI